MLKSDPPPEFHCPWCEAEARARANGALPAEPHPFDADSLSPRPDLQTIDEDELEFVEELNGFRVHDCVRLIALPEGLLEELDEWERPDYLALVGERFELMGITKPNICDLWIDRPGPNGEQGWECFTMPLELLEKAEWDPEPEDARDDA